MVILINKLITNNIRYLITNKLIFDAKFLAITY